MNVVPLCSESSRKVLSHSERIHLQELANGSDFKALEERLGISEMTSILIIESAVKKLAAKNKYHAIAIALRAGQIS